MEYIAGKRQSGRTTKLINRTLINEDACLVVMHHTEKRRILELEPKLKNRVFAFGEAMNKLNFRGTKFKEVYIDNADYMLQSLIPKTITLISLEEEDGTI